MHAELLGATTGVQMEAILEIESRDSFLAWRRLVSEMERDTVSRKLAIIEASSRPNFGNDVAHRRQC